MIAARLTLASRTSITTLQCLSCVSRALNVLYMCPGYQLISESPSTSSSRSTGEAADEWEEAEDVSLRVGQRKRVVAGLVVGWEEEVDDRRLL